MRALDAITGRRSKFVVALLVILLAGGLASRAGSVTTTSDPAVLLPEGAESVRALRAIERFPSGDVTSAVVVAFRRGGLTGTDRDELAALQRELGGSTAPPRYSENGSAGVLISTFNDRGEEEVVAEAERIRRAAARLDRGGLDVAVTGGAGFAADVEGSSAASTASDPADRRGEPGPDPPHPHLPLADLLGHPVLHRAAGRGRVARSQYFLGEAGLALTGQATGIASVLTFGAATDYALLLVARFVVPAALALVALILVVLLRALVLPLLLIVTVIASFAAAFGAGVLVSDLVFGFAGVETTLPLIAFIFLVALGVDYNIFLVARAREEALKHGSDEGMLRALAATGAVITSAGIVLAGTFSILALIPLWRWSSSGSSSPSASCSTRCWSARSSSPRSCGTSGRGCGGRRAFARKRVPADRVELRRQRRVEWRDVDVADDAARVIELARERALRQRLERASAVVEPRRRRTRGPPRGARGPCGVEAVERQELPAVVRDQVDGVDDVVEDGLADEVVEADAGERERGPLRPKRACA